MKRFKIKNENYFKKKNNIMKNYNKIESVSPSGHGHYEVVVRRYGKIITAITSNMVLIDKYKSYDHGYKTAGNQLYDFVVYTNKNCK